jgi:nucleotide-binding universal stress UspA family protein
MKVLLAVDELRDAQVVVRLLERFRFHPGTTVSLLHVIEPPHLAVQYAVQNRLLSEWRKKAKASARQVMSRIAPILEAKGVPVRAIVKYGRPGQVLLKTMESSQSDLAILAALARPRLSRFLLGSVTELVLSEAPCSVLIVRPGPRSGFLRDMSVLLPMDFSKEAERAGRLFAKLGVPPRSHVTLLHVEEEESALDRMAGMGVATVARAFAQVMRERKRRTLTLLRQMGRRLRSMGCAVDQMFARGAATDEILRTAERHQVELIVMGSKGYTGLDRYVLGSVSLKVARYSLCSVLVVRNRPR